MAAFDLPWISNISTSGPPLLSNRGLMDSGPATPRDPNAPTIAAFSPPSSSAAIKSTHQATQKSPLLVATPPQITRALSQSYPYARAANYIMGLLTWTTRDPWESFLMVAVFWGIALYGEVLLKYGGHIVAVLGLSLGMFVRRYKKDTIHPSLDKILENLTTLTTRLNIFFEPFYNLTRFLSTQKTPTSATTAPAIITLLIRVLFISPLWILLSCYPFNIITSRRIVLFVGTTILSWHSRPAKVTRTILWRSSTIRNVCEQLTGLSFTLPVVGVPPPLPPRNISTTSLAPTIGPTTAHRVSQKSTPLQPGGVTSPGVKFTFVIFENQRRWLGIGWNTSLFAYERAPWTDENLEPCPPPLEFQLPETPPNSGVKWRWVAGEDWSVEHGEPDTKKGGKKQVIKDKLGGGGEEGQGWIYYDNKWNNGSRDGDGWGKYTRRRKWIRNAELVEARPDDEVEIPTIDPPPVYTESMRSRESLEVGNRS